MVDLKIVCEDEKYMPAYATGLDACMDLKVKITNENPRSLQVGTFEFINDYEDSSTIMPQEGRVFGTGVKVAIPEDHVMLIFPRSSTGFKLNCMLSNTTGVIDAGYRDEIKIKLYNYGDEPVRVEDGQRIAQFIIIPRPKVNLVQVQDDKDFREGDRGGGIGSTGKA